MKILVAHGSKMGGTAGLAEAIADGLRGDGYEVDVRPANSVDGLAAWDAVALGGGLYAFRWHRSARSFVRRHLDELRQMPVWFFSSGPLDNSASQTEIVPTGPVRRLMNLVGARSHATFGGRLNSAARGWIAGAMVKAGKTGDFRDMQAARSFGSSIAGQLTSQLAWGTIPERPRRERPIGRLQSLVVALTLATGISAVAGGISLMFAPLGWGGMDPSLMRDQSPFHDFFFPGLVLTSVVGLSNLLSCYLVRGRRRGNELAAAGAGCILAGWLTTELWLIPGLHWLQVIYGLIALGTVTFSLLLWLRRPRLYPAARSPVTDLRLRPT